MESIIKWNNIKEKKPPEFGWVLVVVKPVNFEECEKYNVSVDDWIRKCGLNKVWYHGFKFWNSRVGYGLDITERVIYWAEMPDISNLL